MRGLVFGVYIAGALVALGSLYAFDPVAAAIVVCATPVILLWIAEKMGFIHFQTIPIEEYEQRQKRPASNDLWVDDDVAESIPTLIKVSEGEIPREDILPKYGQQILNEMNDACAKLQRKVEFAEEQLMKCVKIRAQYVDYMKENQQ